MKTLFPLMNSFGRLPKTAKAAIFLGLVFLAAILPASVAHAAGNFSFEPIGNTYKVGDTVSVSVNVNTGSEKTNAVAAEFTYPANLLQYVSADATDSGFSVTAVQSGSSGTVKFHRGAKTPLSGKQLVSRATFKVISAGTAVLNFKNSSVAVSSEDNSSNVATDRGSASYTLVASSGPSNPSPGDNPQQPAPQPAPANPTTPIVKKPVTRITPVTGGSGIARPITLPNAGSIELWSTVDVEPITLQPDGISKVEYYLDDELVRVMTVAPFKYRIDTANLLNGSYKLTTKTFYTNGQTDTVSQTIIISNPFGLAQIRLFIQKYLALIILLIFLIVGIIAVFIVKRKLSGGSGGDDIYPSVDDQYVTPTTPTTPIQ